MTRAPDLTGQVFGSLVVTERSGTTPGGVATWVCICQCGKETVCRANHLRSGRSKSCGCGRTPHGHTSGRISSTYVSWASMLTRCRNPNQSGFEYWGGRGITVCEKWMSFENFLADMGERPAGKTLDRFPDVNGNYEPGNCRWATPKEQRANQRKTTKPVEV